MRWLRRRAWCAPSGSASIIPANGRTRCCGFWTPTAARSRGRGRQSASFRSMQASRAVVADRYNAGGNNAAYTDGDLNYDGKVNFFDIVTLLSANYNTGQKYL